MDQHTPDRAVAESTGDDGGDAPRRRRRVGGLARHVVVLLAGAAAALVVTEFGTRLVLGKTGAPDAERPTVSSLSFNTLGFREREIGPKRADRYRIAVVGDSYTWGQGLEERERFSNVLEALLGPHFEVLNFGVPGHTMREDLEELDQVLALSPDFVLLQMYINNFETPEMRRPKALPLLPAAIDGPAGRASVVYQRLDDRWAQAQESLGLMDSYAGYMARYLRDPESPASRESFGWLREFFDRTKATRVPSGAVLFPAADAMGPYGSNYPFGFLHDHVASVCADAHVRCLDLLPLFAGMPDPGTTWINPQDAHPNAQTNRRAALEILAAFGSAWHR